MHSAGTRTLDPLALESQLCHWSQSRNVDEWCIIPFIFSWPMTSSYCCPEKLVVEPLVHWPYLVWAHVRLPWCVQIGGSEMWTSVDTCGRKAPTESLLMSWTNIYPDSRNSTPTALFIHTTICIRVFTVTTRQIQWISLTILWWFMALLTI